MQQLKVKDLIRFLAVSDPDSNVAIAVEDNGEIISCMVSEIGDLELGTILISGSKQPI